jgi:hypothetical protein
VVQPRARLGRTLFLAATCRPTRSDDDADAETGRSSTKCAAARWHPPCVRILFGRNYGSVDSDAALSSCWPRRVSRGQAATQRRAIQRLWPTSSVLSTGSSVPGVISTVDGFVRNTGAGARSGLLFTWAGRDSHDSVFHRRRHGGARGRIALMRRLPGVQSTPPNGPLAGSPDALGLPERAQALKSPDRTSCGASFSIEPSGAKISATFLRSGAQTKCETPFVRVRSIEPRARPVFIGHRAFRSAPWCRTRLSPFWTADNGLGWGNPVPSTSGEHSVQSDVPTHITVSIWPPMTML